MLKRFRNKLNAFSARTIERSVKHGVAKQPKGALTFQYRVFNGRVDANEVNRIKKDFGFSEIYLLHGVAMRVNNHAVILTGPRGSGKTTVMKRLVKSKDFKAIEDGIVVIGQKGNDFFVVESGTLPWRQVRARTKSFSPIKGHQISRKGLKKSTRFVEETAIHEGALSEGIASVLTKDRSLKDFKPTAITLGKVIHVSTKSDLHKPLKIVDDKVELTTQKVFSKQTVFINPFQKRFKIINQMEKAAKE